MNTSRVALAFDYRPRQKIFLLLFKCLSLILCLGDSSLVLFFFLFQAVDCLTQMTRVSDVGNRDIGAPRAEVSTCDVQGPSRISQGPHVSGEVKTVLPNLCDEMTERLHDENSDDYDDVLQADSHLISLVEYVNNEDSRTSLQVKGRLREHIAFWEHIQAPAFIIDCIQHGYKIPFF